MLGCLAGCAPPTLHRKFHSSPSGRYYSYRHVNRDNTLLRSISGPAATQFLRRPAPSGIDTCLLRLSIKGSVPRLAHAPVIWHANITGAPPPAPTKVSSNHADDSESSVSGIARAGWAGTAAPTSWSPLAELGLFSLSFPLLLPALYYQRARLSTPFLRLPPASAKWPTSLPSRRRLPTRSCQHRQLGASTSPLRLTMTRIRLPTSRQTAVCRSSSWSRWLLPARDGLQPCS